MVAGHGAGHFSATLHSRAGWATCSCGHLPVITGYFYGIIHSINGVIHSINGIIHSINGIIHSINGVCSVLITVIWP